ncbi:MAG: pilus assembly protein N-terminal domain-containing protein [Rhodopseudomonas palustris]|nr:pilus assembly protein N-terminal domain-containing protein [Rhodopseudomonas palustris]
MTSRTCWSPIPLIANAVVRSRSSAYIIGVEVGQTNIVFFDSRRSADRRL